MKSNSFAWLNGLQESPEDGCRRPGRLVATGCGVCRAIAQRITHSFLVPAMLLFMLQSPAAAKGDCSSLNLIAYGGSPISDTLLQQAMQVFKCDFLQVYGLTEVSGPATFLMPDDHRTAATQPELLRSAICGPAHSPQCFA